MWHIDNTGTYIAHRPDDVPDHLPDRNLRLMTNMPNGRIHDIHEHEMEVLSLEKCTERTKIKVETFQTQ